MSEKLWDTGNYCRQKRWSDLKIKTKLHDFSKSNFFYKKTEHLIKSTSEHRTFQIFLFLRNIFGNFFFISRKIGIKQTLTILFISKLSISPIVCHSMTSTTQSPTLLSRIISHDTLWWIQYSKLCWINFFLFLKLPDSHCSHCQSWIILSKQIKC